jgi:hypothetical protein
MVFTKWIRGDNLVLAIVDLLKDCDLLGWFNGNAD